MEPLDNYYGDLIIADFNFDDKEDIAVIKDSGGSSGALYNYYIQNKDGKFLFDKFLSIKMESFPTVFNAKTRTLTTLVLAGANRVAKTTYRLNTTTNRWTTTSKSYLEN